MELYSHILFIGGLLVGMGCCLFVAAAIMSMVLLDD
jgi:hypothetical protein